MNLGLMLGVSMLGAAPPALDPSTLALTGWYRGSFTAAPWVGTASAGSSGSHSLITDAHDPAVGTALNGHAAADFAGTHWLHDNITTEDVYLSPTAYRVHLLVYVTGTSAPAGAIYDNPGLVTDSAGGSFGAVINSAGVHVYHAAVLVASSADALAASAWHDIDILFDGAHVTITVDGVAGTPGASVSTGVLTGNPLVVGANYAKAVRFNGQIEDLILAATALSSTTPAAFRGYNNARYGLAL